MKRFPVLAVLFVAVLLLFSAAAASSPGTFEIAQLTTNSVDDFPPQVSGDRVVWAGYGGTEGGSDREIFTWTLEPLEGAGGGGVGGEGRDVLRDGTGPQRARRSSQDHAVFFDLLKA